MKALVAALLLMAAAADPPVVDAPAANSTFPDTVQLTPAAAHLTRLGTTQVDRNYLPFYEIAVYRETKRGTAAGLAGGLEPVRVSIRWLAPAITSEDMAAYWNAAFRKVALDDQLTRLEKPIERLSDALGAAKRGDPVDFDYNPESGLHLIRDGRVEAQLAGLEFNRLFLSIWLGEKADPAVRGALLGSPNP